MCEFIKKLNDNNIDFLLVGNENCGYHRYVFSFIIEGKIKFGFTKPKTFNTPEGDVRKLGSIQWITNLKIEKENLLKLNKTYSPDFYLKYDNYEAINVDKLADIPNDYYGIMGVPITYLTKHNPEIFKILGISHSNRYGSVPYTEGFKDHGANPVLNGKLKYLRVFIQRI